MAVMKGLCHGADERAVFLKVIRGHYRVVSKMLKKEPDDAKRNVCEAEKRAVPVMLIYARTAYVPF